MNELFWRIRGYYLVELTGASPQWALNELTKNEVPFREVCWNDSFTVSVCVPENSLQLAQKCTTRAMCELSILDHVGARIALRSALHRPVLLVMIALTIMAAYLLPRYVFFYQVVGNDTVPDELILRTMDELGVGFGTLGTKIKPQWVKDRVLNKLPDLEWLTVTQNGCRAQVVVRERKHLPETLSRKGYANVVATQSGLITNLSVLAGQPMIKVGDTVVQGDILVSGLVDLERTFLLQRAQAEIYARTWRKTETITPMICYTKQYTGEKQTVVWLEIGDQRIKIFGNSGISVGSCDKMVKRKDLVLPGGLKLPVTWVEESYISYIPVEMQLSETILSDMLQENVRQHTIQNMVAGQILNESWQSVCDDTCLRLTGILECHEMIAASVEARWEQGGIGNDRENYQRGENGADH